MRISSVVVGLAFAAIAAGASGCRVSVETKTRYTVTTGPETEKEDTADWAGEPISIEIKGVGLASNGGVKVIADPSATKVTAKARFLAMAFDKPDADASILDVSKRYTLTRADGQIKLACDHGDTHGESNSGESGCEYVEVRIPTQVTVTASGAREQGALQLHVLSGNGTLTLQLASSTISSEIPSGWNAAIEGNASLGDIDADFPATQGGTISFVAGNGDIEAKLPSNFAADTVILATEDEPIDLGPFTDIKNGTGAGGRGTAGTGLKELHLTARGLGQIKLSQ